MAEKRKVWSIILRIGAAAIAVVLAGLILFFANGIVGNPISKAIATNKVEKYLEGVYPGSTIDDVYFSFDGGAYIFACTIDGKQRNIRYQRKTITDGYAATYYEDKFKNDFQEVQKQLKTDTLTLEAFIGSWVNINENYSTDFGKLSPSIRLFLTIENKDTTILEEKSGQMAAEMTRQVLDALEDMYHINMIDVVYIDKFGSYNIQLQDETFTFEKLLENTKVDLFIDSENEIAA